MPLRTILAILTVMAIGMTAIAGLAIGDGAALVVALCTGPAYAIAIWRAASTTRYTR